MNEPWENIFIFLLVIVLCVLFFSLGEEVGRKCSDPDIIYENLDNEVKIDLKYKILDDSSIEELIATRNKCNILIKNMIIEGEKKVEKIKNLLEESPEQQKPIIVE